MTPMEPAKLYWIEIGKDEDGFAIENRKELQVYAKELSVKRAEAYEAMRAGVKVEIILEIRQEEWEQTKHMEDGKRRYASKISFDGCEYEIIRTYKKGKSMIELVCG